MEAFAVVGLLLFLITMGVAVVFVLVDEGNRTPPETRPEKIQRLREENEIASLERAIWTKKQWAQMEPLKIEAKGASLVQRRDERMLDAFMARQALQQVFDQVTGRGRIIDGNPIGTAIAALQEEIEGRKADGLETSDVEEALRRLRDAQQ